MPRHFFTLPALITFPVLTQLTLTIDAIWLNWRNWTSSAGLLLRSQGSSLADLEEPRILKPPFLRSKDVVVLVDLRQLRIVTLLWNVRFEFHVSLYTFRYSVSVSHTFKRRFYAPQARVEGAMPIER